MNTRTETLDLLRESPFFEGMEREHLEHFARHAWTQTFEPGEHVMRQGDPATAFYVLASGKIELSFAKAGVELTAPDEETGPEMEGHTLPHIVGHRGYPVGWASLVEPHRYRATAVARERTEMLVLKRDLFEAYAKERPDFGLAFMRRVLWLIGNHLRMTRTRLVAARYGNVPQTVRALLDQNAATLSVASPLHKIPHYLENRLTLDDAHRTLELLKVSGDAVERELAAQISDLLDEVWREVRIFRQLQEIYDLVAGAPPTMSPEELRRRSCEKFAELFEGTEYIIRGEENLPDEPGHIFVMNHLSNHLDNLLPNDFILTLDTHFVSSMILLKKYGEAPVRVVRKSDPGEYGHQKFYDRLGYIYVYSGYVDPTDDPRVSPEQRRRLFVDTAEEDLKNGRNIVICPEGTSTETENSPLPFKTGAFHLASNIRPEPLVVPIAVANFDKKLTRTTTVAVVHEPIRLSEHLGENVDSRALREFVNDHVYGRFQGYVREAVRLAAGQTGGPSGSRVSR
ncbi:MAG: cyclic nucleotide-binding domain-containing protein [Actinomycetota bacterium]|nr:cyclic nucleotide-binding domain-containing protein [Actinomycetota bacterium]